VGALVEIRVGGGENGRPIQVGLGRDQSWGILVGRWERKKAVGALMAGADNMSKGLSPKRKLFWGGPIEAWGEKAGRLIPEGLRARQLEEGADATSPMRSTSGCPSTPVQAGGRRRGGMPGFGKGEGQGGHSCAVGEIPGVRGGDEGGGSGRGDQVREPDYLGGGSMGQGTGKKDSRREIVAHT